MTKRSAMLFEISPQDFALMEAECKRRSERTRQPFTMEELLDELFLHLAPNPEERDRAKAHICDETCEEGPSAEIVVTETPPEWASYGAILSSLIRKHLVVQ